MTIPLQILTNRDRAISFGLPVWVNLGLNSENNFHVSGSVKMTP